MNKEEIINQIKKEAEKTWNFHNSHNGMTNQPKGVMLVDEAKKLFNEFLSNTLELQEKEFEKRIKSKNWNELFSTKEIVTWKTEDVNKALKEVLLKELLNNCNIIFQDNTEKKL